jgi:hypothetical protein
VQGRQRQQNAQLASAGGHDTLSVVLYLKRTN